MAALLAIGIVVLLLAVFDVIVLNYGADSRPGIDDEPTQSLTPRWV
jgi:hypothetical protein